ncbi:hypothetical protein S7711_10279 [Stachybotrys chartarum IBT 7711]|uniref:Uncharacterized protein n=1 Tax=Stachybotrys chartarum (strain CBS 109288 / IBT 7711) TaxID=1280523 RepID=A0A084AF54_STACB|nr:hypothetical protein S7711_10279 [Stachybotrys chartarum IBT 7711]
MVSPRQKAKTLRKVPVNQSKTDRLVGAPRHSGTLSNALRSCVSQAQREGTRETFPEEMGVPPTDAARFIDEESSPEVESHVVDISQCASTENQTNHVISPALARDMQLLGRWFAPARLEDAQFYPTDTPRNPFNVVSANPRDPIVHLSVPRRRRTALHEGCRLPGFQQFESIEHILDPLGRDVLDLYFEHFHPAFPLQTLIRPDVRDLCRLPRVLGSILRNLSNKKATPGHGVYLDTNCQRAQGRLQ